MSEKDSNKKSAGRLTAYLLLLIGGALLVGALVAPYVFNLLVYAARNVSWLEGLRNVQFEDVAGRCVLISLLAGMILVLKAGDMASRTAIGYPRGAPWKRHIMCGWGLGVVSMLLLLLIGWISGSYYLDDAGRTASRISVKMISYLFGAFLVGYMEETIFRGAVFGILRRGCGVWAGALVASVFFAAVHFAKPEPPVGVVYGHWYSGLRMLPHMFSRVDLHWEFGFMFMTLFVMGMALCLFYAHFRNLYFVIGLHAGWIWIMKAGSFFFEREQARHLLLFGPSMTVAKSVVAMLVGLVFAGSAGYLYWRRTQGGAGCDVG